MPKDKGKATATRTSSKDNVRWSEEMDALLVDSLLEQQAKGNFIDGQLSTTGYGELLNALQLVLGPSIRKDHIKNRLKTLKDHFAKCYDLFNSWSGISWDPITQRFDAEPHVWKEIVEAKPEAAKWMRTKVGHYDKLYELYATDRATGRMAESARDAFRDWDREGINLNDVVEDDMPQPNFHWPNDTPSPGNMDGFSPSYGNSSHSQGTQSSKGSKRKAPMNDMVEAQIEKMTQGLNDLTDAIRQGNDFYDKTITVAERQTNIAERGLTILEQSRPRIYTEQDVCEELETFNITPEVRMRCYLFLSQDERVKRVVFGVPPPIRFQTLCQLMTNAGISWY